MKGDIVNEQEKTEKMQTFRGAAESLIKMFEVHSDGLRQMSEVLENRKAGLDERAKDLDERETKVARRENEVANVRLIAAERKTQVEVAQDSAAKADKARRNAEAEMRLMKKEKEQLEAVLAKLLQEKNELAAELTSLKQSEKLPEDPAPVAEVAKENA